MSESNPIKLFVTHVFSDSEDYQRVFEFLESVDKFFYINTSEPDNVPGGGGKEALQDEFRRQIEPAEVVVILAGQYEENREWFEFQLNVAGAFKKPVLAIKPFGGVSETPAAVSSRANDVVDWNDRSMVDAIRFQARGEDTTRWEVIDFP